MKKLMIIGAGGHGRVAADIAEECGYQEIAFLDDNPSAVGVAGAVSEFRSYIDTADFFVAIGGNATRRRVSEEIEQSGGHIVNLIHPAAVLSKHATIGRGVVMMAGAVVNAGAVIGNGVILNTGSSVDHDCVIADFVHVSVGAHVAGTVSVGDNTFIGAGATVINNVTICENCMIGAGAAVIRTIDNSGTYVGVPAIRLK